MPCSAILWLTCSILVIFPGIALAQPEAGGATLVEQLQRAALTGDLSSVQKWVNTSGDSQDDLVTAELLKQYRARFVDASAEPVSGELLWLNDLIGAYHRYWRSALIGTLPSQQAEDLLLAFLQDRLPAQNDDSVAFSTPPSCTKI